MPSLAETRCGNYDVTLDREIFLYDLEKQIDLAILHRARVTFTDHNKTTIEEKALIERGEVPDINRPSLVHVANPHDYRDLLLRSFRKLGITPGRAVQLTDETLKHEFEHHIPLLGHEKVKEVWYCVEFYEDKQKRMVGIRPSITIPGAIPTSLYEEFLASPSDKSLDDLRKLKFLRGQKNILEKITTVLNHFRK